jgi:hypothetical protein
MFDTDQRNSIKIDQFVQEVITAGTPEYRETVSACQTNLASCQATIEMSYWVNRQMLSVVEPASGLSLQKIAISVGGK